MAKPIADLIILKEQWLPYNNKYLGVIVTQSLADGQKYGFIGLADAPNPIKIIYSGDRLPYIAAIAFEQIIDLYDDCMKEFLGEDYEKFEAD